MESTASTCSVTPLEKPQSFHQDQGSASWVESDTSIDGQFQNLSFEKSKTRIIESNGVEEMKSHYQTEILSCDGSDTGDHGSGKIGSDEEGRDGGREGTREKYEEGNENESYEVKERDKKDVGEVKKRVESHYPVRPEAEDCSFYLRTGTCKFGMSCKFNHPPTRKKNLVHNAKEKDEQSESANLVDCKFYDRPGGCRYGEACKFNHNKKGSGSTVELNFMGLPLRLGEKECPYYMRRGSCKYGANCRFHHPEPTAVGGSGAVNGGPMASKGAPQSNFPAWSVSVDLKDTVPYIPLMVPSTHGVPSSPKWSTYQAPVYAPERSPVLPPAQRTNYLPRTNVYGPQREQMIDEFPERPGQPECSYFMKTGNCRYRSACKFHHPKDRNANGPPCALSNLGLPLRPGQNICSHYSRFGICKFGPECKYDHPENNAAAPSLPRLDQSSSFGISNSGEALMVATGNGS